jgi:hypothetical protein
VLDRGGVVVSRPVQDALEAYVAFRLELTDVDITFDMDHQTERGYGGDRTDVWVFSININGTDADGDREFRYFEGDKAVCFLDAAMSWEGPA